MKKLLIAAGIGICIFTMATTNGNAGSYEYKDLTQDTTPKKKKDTTKPKKDSLTVQFVSPVT
ncbi:MAG TPA: hypothetical protein VK616_04420 [Flavitalea sp.]|nr:hypothetical protein [Flavitalea sp.]